ncbi:hypothetical protein G6L74_26200 [Agrobacterium tumefaciens]|jgi:hypothetical protein|uniref:hypothetical protein n=1 Tax=Agrobacterium tumefaciens TaxID=358 RepID=UPI00157250C3|nr:hypothetical protein [Agrobacterium tumefaciens]
MKDFEAMCEGANLVGVDAEIDNGLAFTKCIHAGMLSSLLTGQRTSKSDRRAELYTFDRDRNMSARRGRSHEEWTGAQ